jgi:hypothetical protein
MPDRADVTGTRDAGQLRWQPAEVTRPHLGRPVPLVAARDIPYIRKSNRLQNLQNLSTYLPRTPPTGDLALLDDFIATRDVAFALCSPAPRRPTWHSAPTSTGCCRTSAVHWTPCSQTGRAV